MLHTRNQNMTQPQKAHIEKKTKTPICYNFAEICNFSLNQARMSFAKVPREQGVVKEKSQISES